MRKVNRLRPLQVRVPGDDDIFIRLAKRNERLLQVTNFLLQFHHLVAEPHPHVEGDLIVARAPGVQFRPGRLALGQLRLDVHVNILKRFVPVELACLDIIANRLQCFGDALGLCLGQHADAPKHGRMRDRPKQVVPPHPSVKRDRLGELGYVLPRPAAEPSTPGHWRCFLHPGEGFKAGRWCFQQKPRPLGQALGLVKL